jgi:hypothetical protein
MTDCESCVYNVHEKDTGMSWCKKDKEPKSCELFITPDDSRNDAKYGKEDRY